MQNLNGHQLCAIDVETTGCDPRKHDVIQIAIIPLRNDITPSKEYLPFIMDIIPQRPENIDSEAMRINRMRLCDIMLQGMDSFRAVDLFLEWHEKLKLGYNKRIMALGCNYPFDRAFLMEWLGVATYNLCFDSVHRDVQTVATFLNDRAGWNGMDFPYPKVNLSYLCTQLKIEYVRKHEALEDARVTAEVYRRMIQEFV